MLPTNTVNGSGGGKSICCPPNRWSCLQAWIWFRMGVNRARHAPALWLALALVVAVGYTAWKVVFGLLLPPMIGRVFPLSSAVQSELTRAMTVEVWLQPHSVPATALSGGVDEWCIASQARENGRFKFSVKNLWDHTEIWTTVRTRMVHSAQRAKTLAAEANAASGTRVGSKQSTAAAAAAATAAAGSKPPPPPPTAGDVAFAELVANEASAMVDCAYVPGHTLSIDEWHHFVMTYSSHAGEIRMYGDGVLGAVCTQPALYGGLAIKEETFTMGRCFVMEEAPHFLDGDFAAMRVWNQALTPNQVLTAMSSAEVEPVFEAHTGLRDRRDGSILPAPRTVINYQSASLLAQVLSSGKTGVQAVNDLFPFAPLLYTDGTATAAAVDVAGVTKRLKYTPTTAPPPLAAPLPLLDAEPAQPPAAVTAAGASTDTLDIAIGVSDFQPQMMSGKTAPPAPAIRHIYLVATTPHRDIFPVDALDILSRPFTRDASSNPVSRVVSQYLTGGATTILPWRNGGADSTVSAQLNRLLAVSTATHLLWLAPHVIPSPGSVLELWSHRARSSLVIPRVLDETGHLRHAGFDFKDTPTLLSTATLPSHRLRGAPLNYAPSLVPSDGTLQAVDGYSVLMHRASVSAAGGWLPALELGGGADLIHADMSLRVSQYHKQRLSGGGAAADDTSGGSSGTSVHTGIAYRPNSVMFSIDPIDPLPHDKVPDVILGSESPARHLFARHPALPDPTSRRVIRSPVHYYMHCAGSMGYEATQFFPLLEDLIPLRIQPLRYGYCEHLDTLGSLPSFYRDAIERLRFKPKPEEATSGGNGAVAVRTPIDATDSALSATDREWIHIFHRDWRQLPEFISSVSRGYIIGRYMFELWGLHRAWADHCASLSEVWVPSQWQVDMFVAQGVPRHKLVIIPEAVDTDLFDPELVQPLPWLNSHVRHAMLTRAAHYDVYHSSHANVGPDTNRRAWHPVLASKSGRSSRQKGSGPEFDADASVLARMKAIEDSTGTTVTPTAATATIATATATEKKKPYGWIFLTVFKLEDRKGWRELLSAYVNEFSAAEPVSLILHTYLYAMSGDMFDRDRLLTTMRDYLLSPAANLTHTQKRRDPQSWPHFDVVGNTMTASQLRELYRGADAYIQTSYGEGWGLPAHEAMSMGLPVLVPDWSSMTEFCTREVSYLMSIDRLASTEHTTNSDLADPDFRWAIPSRDSIQSTMRHVATQQDEARAKGARARLHIIQNFSPPVVVTKIAARLQQIERNRYKPAAAADENNESGSSEEVDTKPAATAAVASPAIVSFDETPTGQNAGMTPSVCRYMRPKPTLFRSTTAAAGQLPLSTTSDVITSRHAKQISVDAALIPVPASLDSQYLFESTAPPPSYRTKFTADPETSAPLRLAIISTYPPQQCGIATFIAQLLTGMRHAIDTRLTTLKLEIEIIPLVPDLYTSHTVREMGALNAQADTDARSGKRMITRIKRVIRKKNAGDYFSIIPYINGRFDYVLLQHEFGLFGGEAGSYVVCMLSGLTVPVVTTLHMLAEKLDSLEHSTLKSVVELSHRAVVMTALSKRYLDIAHGLTGQHKVQIIPHGAPDPIPRATVLALRGSCRTRHGWEDRIIITALGLMHAAKGLEVMLEAMPAIIAAVPKILFLIAGQSHPSCGKVCAKYEARLNDLILSLQLSNHVIWWNRFLPSAEMKELRATADFVLAIYTDNTVSSSGTISSALAAGQLVVGTPFIYAKEVLGDGRTGVLVPYEDRKALATTIVEICNSPGGVEQFTTRYGARAQELARATSWSAVATSYLQLMLPYELPGTAAPTVWDVAKWNRDNQQPAITGAAGEDDTNDEPRAYPPLAPIASHNAGTAAPTAASISVPLANWRAYAAANAALLTPPGHIRRWAVNGGGRDSGSSDANWNMTQYAVLFAGVALMIYAVRVCYIAGGGPNKRSL